MILFISYIDFEDKLSGSTVRPQKMYDAFVKLGYDIFLVSGAQNNRAERKKKVQQAIDNLNEQKPEFCYIELPSGSILNAIDRTLILKLHRIGVPIAAFYRDAFYKFAPWWDVSPQKRLGVNLLYTIDNLVLGRCCNIIYFPSKTMAHLFSFHNKGVLPPACEKKFLKPREAPCSCIYVGGLSRRYGTDNMLYAFELLNKTGMYPLTIICREGELHEIDVKYLSMPWLSVAQASGEELEQYYSRADIGLYCGRRDIYMDFAVPVKVFEYLSYGLPVITTNCTEIAAFIKKNDAGMVVNDDFRSISTGVKSLISHPNNYLRFYENIIKAVKKENLWVHRAKQVADELSKYIDTNKSNRDSQTKTPKH